MRLTTSTTLPAADQAAALQSALERAAAADSVSTCLYLHLTDFTLGPELERVLAGAKGSGRHVRVSMVGGRCSRRALALASPLPRFTRLELVGMCEESTETGHAQHQPVQQQQRPVQPQPQQLQPHQLHPPAAPLFVHTPTAQHNHMGPVLTYTAAAQVSVLALPGAVMPAPAAVHATPAAVSSTVPAQRYAEPAVASRVPALVQTALVMPAAHAATGPAYLPTGAQQAFAASMAHLPVIGPLGRPAAGAGPLSRPVAVTGNQYGPQTWAVSVRELMRLLHRSDGGADSVALHDCVLAFDLEGTEEVSVRVCVSFVGQRCYEPPQQPRVTISFSPADRLCHISFSLSPHIVLVIASLVSLQLCNDWCALGRFNCIAYFDTQQCSTQQRRFVVAVLTRAELV